MRGASSSGAATRLGAPSVFSSIAPLKERHGPRTSLAAARAPTNTLSAQRLLHDLLSARQTLAASSVPDVGMDFSAQERAQAHAAFLPETAHPVEAIQRDWLRSQLDTKHHIMGNVYGSHLPMRIKMEMNILPQRLVVVRFYMAGP